MVFIFVLLTFALVLTIRLIFASRPHAAVREEPPAAWVDSGERFFHPGHSWVLVEPAAAATVGIDNFAQRFLGRPERVELPAKGVHVRQGEPLVRLHRGKKSLVLVSPLSGTLTEINPRLADQPEVLNDSPYGDGWLVKLTPSNLALEVRNLMRGITASVWREALRTQLVQWFSPRMGTVLQDGGRMVENLSDLVDDDEWQKLLRDFFPVERQSEQQHLQPLK